MAIGSFSYADTLNLIGFTRAVNGANGGLYFGGYKLNADNSVSCDKLYGSKVSDCRGNCKSDKVFANLKDKNEDLKCSDSSNDSLCIASVQTGNKSSTATQIQKVSSVKVVKFSPPEYKTLEDLCDKDKTSSFNIAPYLNK